MPSVQSGHLSVFPRPWNSQYTIKNQNLTLRDKNLFLHCLPEGRLRRASSLQKKAMCCYNCNDITYGKAENIQGKAKVGEAVTA